MRHATKNRKMHARQINGGRYGGHMAAHVQGLLEAVIQDGKAGYDLWSRQLGLELAGAIMEIERQERAGADYQPLSAFVRKGGSQRGSVYVEDQKFPMDYPRMQEWNPRHGKWVESPLESYQRLHDKRQFSQQLLTKAMKGLAGRRYEETVGEMAGAFGVSRSAVSRHIVAASAAKLAAFRERPLADFIAFAIHLDTVHRGDSAFIVALGINEKGEKMVLGFWEGATENRDICIELFGDLERRGLKLSAKTIFVVDGGKGVISALKARYKGELLLQRCRLHKLRNIAGHLPKKYRGEVTKRFHVIYTLNDYAEAKKELDKMEKWLRGLNESAADSLLEAGDSLLTVHRLQVPEQLRKSLSTTNPIESLFSMVRIFEKNITNYRGSSMKQRWFGAVLLEAEKSFRRVKGYASISAVMSTIENQTFAKLPNEC